MKGYDAYVLASYKLRLFYEVGGKVILLWEP